MTTGAFQTLREFADLRSRRQRTTARKDQRRARLRQPSRGLSHAGRRRSARHRHGRRRG